MSLNNQDFFKLLEKEAAADPNAPRPSRSKRAAAQITEAETPAPPAKKAKTTKASSSSSAIPSSSTTMAKPSPPAAGSSSTNPIPIEAPPSPASSLTPPPEDITTAPPPKTVGDWEALLDLLHPHAPSLEKNLPKMMEAKGKTIVWGFVSEEKKRKEGENGKEVGKGKEKEIEEEEERVWVEPPLVADKYSRGPTFTDYYRMDLQPYHTSRPTASTHNVNTSAARDGQYNWQDREDKFWAGDVGRSIKVVKVEICGERVEAKKLKKGERWGWGHGGENHWN